MKATLKKAPDTSATLAVTRRQVLHASVMKKMVPELRARAFAVAWLEDIRRVERVRDAVASVTQGKSWQAATSEVAKELEHILGKEAAKTAARKVVVSETQKAVSVARYREMTDPEEMALFPYWQYKSVGDGHVRDAHSALHGLTLPADDPFWDGHFPPWDYGCRCKVVQVSKAKADRMRAQHDVNLVEDEVARETLRAGHIQAGHGTVDIRTPAQKAITAEEYHVAYRHQPGDLHLNMDDIRNRYFTDDPIKQNLFRLFAQSAQDEIIDKATGRTAWDWLCEIDLRADAKACMEHAEAFETEMMMLRRFDTGALFDVGVGTATHVSVQHPGDKFTIIHCHPSGNIKPSFTDLKSLADKQCAASSIVSAEMKGAKGYNLDRLHIIRLRVLNRSRLEQFVKKWDGVPKVDEAASQYEDEFEQLFESGVIVKEEIHDA